MGLTPVKKCRIIFVTQNFKEYKINTAFSMNLKKLSICCLLGSTSLMAAAQTLHVDTLPELKLNREAVDMIRFDFNSEEQRFQSQPMQSEKKPWMEFKVNLGTPRSLTDTARMKKPESYVRAEPFTIWTEFGEDPVYDVLYNRPDKEWEITMKLPGPTGKVRRTVGLGFFFDADKLLYETFTKRGRAIRRNRKHAKAWKTYNWYLPTKTDMAKLPTYHAADSLSRSQQAEKQRLNDSIALNVKLRMEEMKRRREAAQDSTRQQKEERTDYTRYIEEQLELERRKREERNRKDKVKQRNVYKIEDRNLQQLRRE